MTKVYLNQIETAVPAHDVHEKFVSFAPSLLKDERSRSLFKRMEERCGIEHSYSTLPPHADAGHLDKDGFYRKDDFPGTNERMQRYENHAFALAKQALDKLDFNKSEITHIIVTSCTGFYAPGLDFQIAEHYGLSPAVERTFIGFMGCHAAINALKMARHIVRSEPASKILILNLELCTLHLQQIASLEEMLSFLLFADGCAASIVSAEPQGFELQSFHTEFLPDSKNLITWKIGDAGFNMHLSGRVPAAIAKHIVDCLDRAVEGISHPETQNWAIHPGGRSILDAVRDGAEIPEEKLAASRKILKNYGNMSSPTIMFVLKEIMSDPSKTGTGLAMAFGPGLSVEAMRFYA